MIELDYRGVLQYDQEDLRDHGDSLVSRMKLDFSNVHVYHTDGYIPRKWCLFQFIFRQGIFRHLLLWKLARCTEDGWCWYVRVKAFRRVTKEKIRRWNVDIVGTIVVCLTLGSILVYQTCHNWAAMTLTHPQDLCKPASRVPVRKDWLHLRVMR